MYRHLPNNDIITTDSSLSALTNLFSNNLTKPFDSYKDSRTLQRIEGKETVDKAARDAIYSPDSEIIPFSSLITYCMDTKR